MTKPGRIHCSVLGCRRTAPADKYPAGTQICCGKCWRLGAAEDRRIYRDARRAIRPLQTLTQAERDALEPGRRAGLLRAEAVVHAAFDAVVRTASEARAGIA